MLLIATLVVSFLLDVPFSKADFLGQRLSMNRPIVHSEEHLLETFLNPMSITPNDHVMLGNIFDQNFKTDATHYELFTKDNKEQSVILNTGDVAQLKNSPFNPAWPIKIIIHGWIENSDTFWVHDIRRNYLSVGDYNVICVNWFTGLNREYLTSVRLTRQEKIQAHTCSQVGEHVARFLEFLSSEAGISLDDVHIVGHSLGAHIAGYAGNYASRKLGRITGLDPARPAYETPYLKEPQDRLDPGDAVFVDVIHTCAGSLGFLGAIGHVDFYPNGGTFNQPGCPIISSQYCSHARSHLFFAESIVLPGSFVGAQCGSWTEFQLGKCSDNISNIAVMGEFISIDARGKFYLETNAQPPFGRGEAHEENGGVEAAVM